MIENILELRKVTKTFGDLVAVDGVDFELQAGEIHAILGENGAGKSTLMNLIYGLYQPSDGRIYVTDRENWRRRLRAKSPRDAIANGIGMVHQHFMLIENLTVAENIALALGQLRSGPVGSASSNGDSARLGGKLKKHPSKNPKQKHLASGMGIGSWGWETSPTDRGDKCLQRHNSGIFNTC